MNMRLNVAIGPWSTVATSGPRDPSATGGPGFEIVFAPAAQGREGGTVVTISHTVRDRDYRVVAMDTDGKLVTGLPSSQRIGSLTQATVRFPDLPLDQVREFQFQVRPFHRIEFRNVSLQPGHKTQVEVVAESPENAAAARRAAERFIQAMVDGDVDYLRAHARMDLIDGVKDTFEELVREIKQIAKPLRIVNHAAAGEWAAVSFGPPEDPEDLYLVLQQGPGGLWLVRGLDDLNRRSLEEVITTTREHVEQGHAEPDQAHENEEAIAPAGEPLEGPQPERTPPAAPFDAASQREVLKARISHMQRKLQALIVDLREANVSPVDDHPTVTRVRQRIRALEQELADLNERAVQPEDIHAKLRDRVDVTFDNTRLFSVIEHLKNTSGLNVVVNWQALARAGVGPDTPVTVALQDVALEAVLRVVLDLAAGERGRLGYYFEDGVLVISTAAEAAGARPVQPRTEADPEPPRREVQKLLSQFPNELEPTSPEAAVAAYLRAFVHRDSAAAAALVVGDEAEQELNKWKEANERREATEEERQAAAQARIVEVLPLNSELAAVILYIPREGQLVHRPYFVTALVRSEGKWKIARRFDRGIAELLPTRDAAIQSIQAWYPQWRDERLDRALREQQEREQEREREQPEEQQQSPQAEPAAQGSAPAPFDLVRSIPVLNDRSDRVTSLDISAALNFNQTPLRVRMLYARPDRRALWITDPAGGVPLLVVAEEQILFYDLLSRSVTVFPARRTPSFRLRMAGKDLEIKFGTLDPGEDQDPPILVDLASILELEGNTLAAHPQAEGTTLIEAVSARGNAARALMDPRAAYPYQWFEMRSKGQTEADLRVEFAVNQPLPPGLLSLPDLEVLAARVEVRQPAGDDATRAGALERMLQTTPQLLRAVQGSLLARLALDSPEAQAKLEAALGEKFDWPGLRAFDAQVVEAFRAAGVMPATEEEPAGP